MGILFMNMMQLTFRKQVYLNIAVSLQKLFLCHTKFFTELQNAKKAHSIKEDLILQQ
jgi:hypothetical protein